MANAHNDKAICGRCGRWLVSHRGNRALVYESKVQYRGFKCSLVECPGFEIKSEIKSHGHMEQGDGNLSRKQMG